MNKTKVLTIAVIALFLINIVTLSFLSFNGPKNNDRKQPKEIVIHKLGFDKNQITEYEILIKNHKTNINRLDNQIKNSKNKLYQQLNLPENKVVTDSILNSLNLYKSEIELVHFNHFLDIKKICKPEQLDNYNELTQELSKIFAPKRMPKKDE
jgi:hypothetical protein